MLTVSFESFPLGTSLQMFNGKDLLIPISTTDTTNGVDSYSVTSNSNSGLFQTSIIASGTTLWKLNVSGTDSSNNAFSGDLVFRLFDSETPLTVQRIKTLTNEGFYNGKRFPRILDNFVAQTGSPNNTLSGSSGKGSFNDEFNANLTFTSPGLLALANSGDDTNDSQFFITDIDVPLASMPTFLDFNHSIFGQLVSGFDTFNKVMTTPATSSPFISGENSGPVNPVTINSASIITSSNTAILRVHPTNANTTSGSAQIKVTATSGGDSSTAVQTYNVSLTADNVNDQPFLGSIPATVTTNQNTAVTVNLNPTDLENNALSFSLIDVATNAAPSNISVSFTNGQMILTPAASFAGSKSLRVTVQETANSAKSDSQAFTLVVNPTVRLTSSVTQFSEASGSATITATIDATQSQAITVSLNRTPTPGTDYSASAASITIAAGSTQGTITLTGIDDNISEGTENITVAISSVSGGLSANSSVSSVSLGILDNDPIPGVSLSVSPTSISESGGTTTIVATADRPSSNPMVITLSYAGSAVRGTDFTAPATITIPANATTASVTLSALQDSIDESTESVTIGIQSLTNGQLGATPTQTVSITNVTPVPTAPTSVKLSASSNNSSSASDSYTTAPRPMIQASSTPGQTLQILVNGQAAGTMTDTGSSGNYSGQINQGMLRVGNNSIATSIVGTANSTSSPFTLQYAPSYNSGYVVPGDVQAGNSITFSLDAKYASYQSELGYYVADDSTGSLSGVAPGSAAYAQAVMNSASRHTIFSPTTAAGTDFTVTLIGGQTLGFYLIPNATSAAFLAANPTNKLPGFASAFKPVAFFSFDAANPDKFKHMLTQADPLTGVVEYRWEDLLGGGDRDYNDIVLRVRPSSSTISGETIRPAGGTTASVSTTFTLSAPSVSSAAATQPTFTKLAGEFGVIKVSDPQGTVNGLRPGDVGWLAAALATRQAIFDAGATVGTNKSLNLTGGQELAFYQISQGSATSLLSTNPTNSATDAAFALFSFASANPDQTDHYRWYAPEGVDQGTPSSSDPLRLHVMDELFGSSSDFDSFIVSIK